MPSQIADHDRLREKISRLQGRLEMLKSQLERSLGEARIPGEPFEALLCQVGTELWALPLEAVDEVVLRPALTPLPEAPPWIPGLLNLRGESFAVVDLTARLERRQRSPELGDLIVVCRLEQQRVGLAVQEVHDVQILHPESRQESGVDALRSPYVLGVFPVQGKLALLIAIRRLVLLSDLPGEGE